MSLPRTHRRQRPRTRRRQGRSGLARDHGGRISTLFLDTETVVQPEPFIEGLEPHPAVDVLDTRCRATITVTCVPRPDLTTSGIHPAQLGVRGRCYRLWCTRSFLWFAQFARFSECTQSRARREGCGQCACRTSQASVARCRQQHVVIAYFCAPKNPCNPRMCQKTPYKLSKEP